MSRPIPRHLAALGIVAACAVSACGSTVPTVGQPGPGAAGHGIGSDGLTPGDPSRPAASGATPPDAVPGANGIQPSTALPARTGADLGAGRVDGGTGDDRSSAAGTGGSGSATGRPGVRPGPLSLGFLVTDYSGGAKAAGLGDNENIVSDPMKAFRALVDGLNKNGGLQGRQIAPVYVTIDARDNRQAAFQAACAAFTEDNKVASVVSMGTELDSLSSCLARAGVSQFDANEWQRTRYDINRGFFTPNGLSMARQAAVVINRMAESGWLTPSNRLGVLTDGCPINVETYQRVVVPLARQRKLTVQRQDASNCGSASEAVQGAQAAVLRFRSDGVDRVMYLAEGGEAAGNVIFSTNAESQGYRPGYLLSSAAQLDNFQQYIPQEQRANMRGVGWSPEFFDSITTVTAPPAQQRVQKQCLDLLAAGGYDGNTRVLRYVGLSSCDALFLLREALEASGGETASAALAAAVHGFADRYVSTTAPSGRTGYGGGRQDGVELAANFSYRTSCSCFRYDGAFRPVPSWPR